MPIYISVTSCPPSGGLDCASFRMHDLRHTFASQLLQGGASLAYVRDQLGHSSISVTADLYGHLQPSAEYCLGGWAGRENKSATKRNPRATSD